MEDLSLFSQGVIVNLQYIYIHINVLKRDRDNLNTRPKEAVSGKKLTGFIHTKYLGNIMKNIFLKLDQEEIEL